MCNVEHIEIHLVYQMKVAELAYRKFWLTSMFPCEVPKPEYPHTNENRTFRWRFCLGSRPEVRALNSGTYFISNAKNWQFEISYIE